MEIKHTIEILTKDIQDIEKLVGNLQNSQDGSAIELDLALSKLRNVYEILTMIKADRLHELLHPEKIWKSPIREIHCFGFIAKGSELLPFNPFYCIL